MRRSLIGVLALIIVGLHLMAAVTVNVNGTNHTIPEVGETGWGTNVTNWIVDVSADTLQKKGGSFTLTADVDFGSTYGLEAGYYTSSTASPAGAGVLRLAETDLINWRNNADDGNLGLGISSDALQFNSIDIANISGAQTLTNKIIDADDNSISDIDNDEIKASAGIVYSKLALTDSILNADINSSAAIDYTKLNLTGDLVNADVNASAAIEVSKLEALTASRAVVTDGSGFASAATTTATEIGYVNGVTSSIQTQIDGKTPLVATTVDGGVPRFDGTAGALQTSDVQINDSGNLTMLGGDIVLEDEIGVRFSEAAANGTNYTKLRAADDMAADVTYKLPDADGSSGEVLKTDGSGNLSWGADAGSGANTVTTKTTTYTITTNDYLVLADASSAAFTLTLPTAVGNTGIIFVIKKIDSDFTEVVTIDGDGSETIDGSTTTTLNTLGETLTIISDGTNWDILERRIPGYITDYTPTFTGFGTVTVENFTYHREGSFLIIDGAFTAGTTTATEARVSFPSGLTSTSTLPTISLAGLVGRSLAGDVNHYVLKEPSVSYVTFGGQATAQGALTKKDANSILNSSDVLSFYAKVPITGWKE